MGVVGDGIEKEMIEATAVPRKILADPLDHSTHPILLRILSQLRVNISLPLFLESKQFQLEATDINSHPASHRP